MSLNFETETSTIYYYCGEWGEKGERGMASGEGEERKRTYQ